MKNYRFFMSSKEIIWCLYSANNIFWLGGGNIFTPSPTKSLMVTSLENNLISPWNFYVVQNIHRDVHNFLNMYILDYANLCIVTVFDCALSNKVFEFELSLHELYSDKKFCIWKEIVPFTYSCDIHTYICTYIHMCKSHKQIKQTFDSMDDNMY